jgi:hypothetical protein
MNECGGQETGGRDKCKGTPAVVGQAYAAPRPVLASDKVQQASRGSESWRRATEYNHGLHVPTRWLIEKGLQ